MRELQMLTLVRQSYGIAMAQGSYGGPRGVWLECTTADCDGSDRLQGAPVTISDADAATAFRAGGWTGEGDSMRKARCPRCSR